ncbi:MAG: IclR family transcriptional regulator [Desulfovibrio sp.]|jgi:DNA-binding IclR family transcriptional regulator|nr:IclR family transcriptional regulator [Desulfovibrio sp.]
MKNNPHKYEIKVLEKTFVVLRSFTLEQPRLTFSELLCRNKNIDKTTLYRIVMNLTDHNFLSKNEKTGEFSLGVGFLYSSRIVLAGFDLREAARPYMEAIHKLTGETVVINILNKDRGICLDCIKSTQPLTITADVGRQIPLLRGASGMILVAHLPDEKIRFLYDMEETAEKISFSDILEKVRVIRKNGYGVSFSALDPGTAGVSFPILDVSDNVVAGLSCLGPESRFKETVYLSRIIDITRSNATQLSHALGHVQKTPASAAHVKTIQEEENV